jgi:hypothetical protein
MESQTASAFGVADELAKQREEQQQEKEADYECDSELSIFLVLHFKETMQSVLSM